MMTEGERENAFKREIRALTRERDALKLHADRLAAALIQIVGEQDTADFHHASLGFDMARDALAAAGALAAPTLEDKP